MPPLLPGRRAAARRASGPAPAMISRHRPHGVVAALCLIVPLACGCDGGSTSHPAVGETLGAPPLVSVAEGESSAPAFTGRVTLLNFWATWCPPCRRELPGLVRLARRLADEPRFQLLAVSCGTGNEDPATLARETREFLRGADLALPAWMFSDPRSRAAFTSICGLEALPTTLLVGPDGRVRRVWVGYQPRDEADVAAAVVALIKEVPAAASPAAR